MQFALKNGALIQEISGHRLKSYLQLYLCFIRQTELVIKSEKKNSKRPTIIAPVMLVAAKVTPRSNREVKIVPKIPAKKVARFLQQYFRSEQHTDEFKISMPKYPTAIPKSTHKNAGVMVMTAVYLSTAAIIPIIILARTAFTVQLISQLQFIVIIYFTSAL